MSDEKIDHAAEAADMVKHAATSDDEMERRLTGQAQVHATLALVEQQRIANLIAAFSEVKTVHNETYWAVDGFPPEVRTEVMKGLGL